MLNHRKMILLSACIVLASCAQPMTYTSAMMTAYDKDTSYAVEDSPGGFTVSIEYSRYQFIPESSALAAA